MNETGHRPRVFLSWVNAAPRETSRADEWARRLREAGFEVIDHPEFAGYPRIIDELAHCDAVVLLHGNFESTWGPVEHDSAILGRDLFDGSHAPWSPPPVLIWPHPDAELEKPGHRAYKRRIEALGPVTHLPADLDAAIEEAVHEIGCPPRTTNI